MAKLRQAEVELARGQTFPQVCMHPGITDQTYYRRRKEFGGSFSAKPYHMLHTGDPVELVCRFQGFTEVYLSFRIVGFCAPGACPTYKPTISIALNAQNPDGSIGVKLVGVTAPLQFNEPGASGIHEVMDRLLIIPMGPCEVKDRLAWLSVTVTVTDPDNPGLKATCAGTIFLSGNYTDGIHDTFCPPGGCP